MATGRRLTKSMVDHLPVGSIAWDRDVRGFGVRRQQRDAVYVLKYRASGKQRFYSIGKHGAPWTVETARREATRILGEVARGTDPSVIRLKQRAAPTLADFAERYLIEVSEAHKKQSTAREDRRMLRNHILPKLGSKKIADIDRSDVAKFHAELRDRPVAANRAIALLSHIISAAVLRGERADGPNPCSRVARYPERRRERFLSVDELRRLGAAIALAETTGIPWSPSPDKRFKHAPREENRMVRLEPHAAAALRLLIFTGARLREILHLEWAHVDMDRGLLLLPDSKTGRKTIVLNTAALEVLRNLDRIGKYVVAGADLQKPRADLKRPWALVRTAAGLDGVRIHDLRHTFASFGVGASMGLPIVGRLLGHTQPATTARYAHLEADPLRRATETIGDAISSALTGEPARANATN